MRVFNTVEEEGGFAAASRKLDISPAAVTRAIAALEEHLGVRLIVRTTRSIRLTDAGRQYYEDTRAILTRITEVDEAASGNNAEPHGTLTITAPVLFGRLYVMPCIIQFMQRFPKVKVVANFSDHVTNLIEDGIDVAIRIGNLPDSTLRAIRVGQVRRIICAASSYLDTHGTPETPEELVNHSTIASSPVSSGIEWRFEKDGKNEKVRVNPQLIVSSNDAALSAALGGLGITRLLSYQVRADLENANLRLILEGYEEQPWPINVVHREDKLGSPKVRAFIDHIVDYLRHHPNI
jgi:DNA-binding transcriptional LysR family regulator